MKILNIKLKNINSLAGEWEIDFTDQQFADNGIFAITGKTGAGKSSILDAISLALYGRTPRTDIKGQSNDVMTCNTNDCYSEIVFEVAGKHWKSSWKQEKTRTGNLKPVHRQIADTDDIIHADHARSCDNKIIEILGLTFEQFTKVVMLAQDSFAAFLQADKNDKGELLEQITGTEIYGEISKKVFERNKNEKEKLEKILFELGMIKIFSDTEIENLNHEIVDWEKQKKQIDCDLQKFETAKKWRSDLENLQKQIDQANQNLPELEQRVETAKINLELSDILLKKSREERENTDKILAKVRELDTKITEKEKILHIVLQAINNLERKEKELADILEKQKTTKAESEKTLIEKQIWAKENAKFEDLTGNFAVIENQYLQICNSLKEINRQKKNISETNQELQTRFTNYQKAQMLFVKKNDFLNKKTGELEIKKKELSEILSGKELTDYQNEKEKITKIGTFIKNLIEIEKEIDRNYKEIELFQQNIIIAKNTEEELTKKTSENRTIAKNLEKQINLLDENIKLATTIQSMDEHRKLLKEGQACPLCGALEHPFAVRNIPKIGEKETELKHLKKQFHEIINAIQQDEKTLVKTISDKENALINKEKEEKKLSENRKRQDAILSEINTLKPDFSIPDGNNRIDFLVTIHKQKQNEYQYIVNIISRAINIEKNLLTIQNIEIPQLLREKQSAEKAKNEAETSQKLAEQQLEMMKKGLEEAEKKHAEKNNELLQKFNEYSVANIATLKACLDSWTRNKANMEILKTNISELQNAVTLINAEIENNFRLLKEKVAEKNAYETEKQKLNSERESLFGNKNVHEEEIRLKKLLLDAEKAKSEAEVTGNAMNMELAKTRAVIAEKEKDLSEKQAQKITDKSPDELQAEYTEKKYQSDEFSQKIGANRQLLQSNDANLASNRLILARKRSQQLICNRWGALNELIGASDGKKYRNFAQALTFDHLLALANRHLHKMSERYLLKRVGDTANPFELSVIDRYQNNEERTAQNLSGGEKFIVSLALALGLSNMAGRNMQIDTMFIDEGFGSLDSEYLDTALTALSSLQNEGKLIGVISHLEELKERIATHIEVIPLGNGHSRIEISDGYCHRTF